TTKPISLRKGGKVRLSTETKQFATPPVDKNKKADPVQCSGSTSLQFFTLQGSGLLFLEYHLALVVQFSFVPVRTMVQVGFSCCGIYRNLRSGQCVVRTSFVTTCTGLSAFGMCHDLNSTVRFFRTLIQQIFQFQPPRVGFSFVRFS